MRNYKEERSVDDFLEKLRALGLNITYDDHIYTSYRGLFLMLAEENKHHRVAIDKLQIEVDQLRRRLIIVATGEMPDEQA